MNNFDGFGFDDRILKAIDDAGYEQPTPIQIEAIPPVMEGRDVLGCAQTGTGKTAAFALPIIHHLVSTTTHWENRSIRALVLAPTRELAVQIGDCFRKYAKRTKVRHTVILGGVNQHRQVLELEKGVDVLVATPGRLLDLIEQGYVELRSTEILVLDEADHMLDMGFLPDVRRIINQVPKKRQTLFFSATMPTDIRKLADEILSNPVSLRIKPEAPTADRVDQEVYFLSQRAKPTLLAHLIQQNSDGTTLVFVRTKYSADTVVKKLARFNITAEALHGNKSQNKRQRILGDFRTGQLQVLIATDIAARGIDVKGISHVINYDIPNLVETYVHRIGRTGRAGASGLATSFCNADEKEMLVEIQQQLKKKFRYKELPTGLDLPAEQEVAPEPTGRKPVEPKGRRPAAGTKQNQKSQPSRRSNRTERTATKNSPPERKLARSEQSRAATPSKKTAKAAQQSEGRNRTNYSEGTRSSATGYKSANNRRNTKRRGRR